MNLYDLNYIKKKIKDKNPNFSRVDLENFFCKKNIYGKIISKFYTHQLDFNNDFINEEDLNKIFLLAKLKFDDINLNFLNFKHFISDQQTFEHSIESHNDYIKKLIQFRKFYQSKEIKANKENSKIKFTNLIQNKDIIDGLSIKNIHDKKIISLDFEYRVKKTITFNHCFEFGITIYEDKKLTHKHFIIENENMKISNTKKKLQSKFNFGESTVIPLSQVSEILSKFLSDIDLLVLQGAANELKILTNNNINIPENVSIIDTQKTKENHFNEKLIGCSLNKMLKSFRIDFKNLHNSGNDAAYTLLLFLKMYDSKLKLLKKQSNTIKI